MTSSDNFFPQSVLRAAGGKLCRRDIKRNEELEGGAATLMGSKSREMFAQWLEDVSSEKQVGIKSF